MDAVTHIIIYRQPSLRLNVGTKVRHSKFKFTATIECINDLCRRMLRLYARKAGRFWGIKFKIQELPQPCIRENINLTLDEYMTNRYIIYIETESTGVDGDKIRSRVQKFPA